MFKTTCSYCGQWYWIGEGCSCWENLKKENNSKKVKLFVRVDDNDVSLMFAWDAYEKAWVCKMDDDFMQQLGPLPYRKWVDLTTPEMQEIREDVNTNLSISHPDYSKTLQLATQLKLKEKNHV